MDTHDTNAHLDKDVKVEVDNEQVTSPRDTTVGNLLRAAGLNPATRELVLVQGKHTVDYPDPTTELTLHANERFITVATGPTQVS